MFCLTMSKFQSRNKSTLITAAGVIIFLAAGIFTMLFFPDRDKGQEQTKIIQPKNSTSNSNLISNPEVKPEELKPEVKEEIKAEKPKPDWFVHVAGEVKKPGIYKISADARVFQAIDAAGGFTEKADQTSVNLASFLIDGYQINVLAKGAKKPQNEIQTRVQAKPSETIVIKQQNKTQTQKNSAVTIDNRVNINSASAPELQRLNGVGPAIAARIVEYRNSHGIFSSPEDLLNVRGIGKVKLEKMRKQILIR